MSGSRCTARTRVPREEIALDVEDRLRGIEHVRRSTVPRSSAKEVRVLIDPERARTLGSDPQSGSPMPVGFAFRGQRLRRFHGERGEIEVIVGLPETPPGPGRADRPADAARGGRVRQPGRRGRDRHGAHAAVTSTGSTARRRRGSRCSSTTKRSTTAGHAREVDEAARGLTCSPDGYAWDWGQGEHRDDEALAIMLRGMLISLCGGAAADGRAVRVVQPAAGDPDHAAAGAVRRVLDAVARSASSSRSWPSSA